ncbi:MAG TPA: oleate hydratase, partial [Phototrophicaceae bacterium]|nr:oleate hydratase [Phototrophicaceae bacterium]
MTPGSASRKKIAILGGGMGGMSAAYWLTNRPGWQEDYEITLYQMGWRLGGKGATGRNPEMFQRIEEHGFHFFPGFYENTFAMMRQCYEELGRGSEAPLSEFIAPTQADEHRYPDRYAMHRFNFGGMQEPFNGQWYKFSLYLPENDALPGSGVEHPTAWEYIQMGIDWMWTIYQNSAYWTEPGSPDNGKKEAWWDELSFILDLFVLEAVPLFPSNHLYAAKHIIDRLPTDGESHASRQYLPAYEFIIRRLRSHQKKLWNQVKDEVVTNFRAYSAWTLQDFVATTLIGMLHDEVMLLGFDVVNDLDFSAWMLRHATIPEGTAITIRTPMVRFVYDAGFSVLERDGRIVSEIEAGTALRIGMRMFVYYTGSVFWMFQAGCGETIFAPLYQVLKRRGVKFEFFHKVINLHTNHDTGNDTITELEIQQQAHLKVGEYDPLVMIKGLPCWSSEPAYEQLVEGDILRERQINLESNWSDWQGVGTKHLKRGEDFDDVILAIPLAGLPQIFPDCFKKSSWQMMHEKLMTTRTQSIQLYTNKTQSQMGWTLDRPLLELDNEPISTWADMTPQRRR